MILIIPKPKNYKIDLMNPIMQQIFLKQQTNNATWPWSKECVKYNKTINKNSKYKCGNLCDTDVVPRITYNILKNCGTDTIL